MKILIITSTLPVSNDDKVPSFVKDQAIALKKAYPATDIIIQAPHNSYSKTMEVNRSTEFYSERRFHYFWPFRWELLTGRGILPAIKNNKLLYLQIPFLVFFQFFSLLLLVKKEKPDLLYAHWFTPQAINAAIVSRIAKVPFVFTTHASDVIVLRRLPFSSHIVRWVCRRASSYTAVSQRTADKLMSFFKTDEWAKDFNHKLSILPMGISLDKPVIDKNSMARVKKKFNLPSDKDYILFLGRLAEKKGVKYLLEAFSELPPSITSGLHLIIAGDGQLKSRLQKQAQKLNIHNIAFTGYVHGEDKVTLLALAKYACFPSIVDASGDSEGFPVAIMESLASGAIVLASNTTGLENIIEDGINGYIFSEKNSNDIANRLREAISLESNTKQKISRNAKKLASRFDIEVITQQYADILGVNE
jgi:glycosyltransferase involved in cell wall biosynthesis